MLVNMIYAEPLPKTDRIMHLAEVAGPFPATGSDIVRTARRYNFGPDTVHFLKLFPGDVMFENREDFSVRSQELMFLIREERAMEDEGPLSPQD